ncbi:MAG: hypothetical protein RLZZ303_1147, partial [Candidatus Hydrogenedentota bacterium]
MPLKRNLARAILLLFLPVAVMADGEG